MTLEEQIYEILSRHMAFIGHNTNPDETGIEELAAFVREREGVIVERCLQQVEKDCMKAYQEGKLNADKT